MREKLIVLDSDDLLALLRLQYPDAEHIELYIEYNDEGVEGNDVIIAEINVLEDDE